MDKVRLAESDDVEGGELGSIIKEAVKWVKVFQLDMTEIARIVEKSLWSQDLMNQVMKYSRDEMRDSIKISKLQDSERIL